jgi:hypothetical protein
MKRVEIEETDNRDCYETDLILDNRTVVSVDVMDLFENMLENIGDEDILNKFYELKQLIKKLIKINFVY